MTRLRLRSGAPVCEMTGWLGWKPDTVIQVGIGMNHGETEVFRDPEYWGDTFRLIGVEPNPRLIEMARDNYPGEVLPYAIGSEPGEATLFFRSGHKDGGSLHPYKTGDQNEVVVPVRTLDGLFTEPESMGDILLWLDCEGNELPAMQGGEKLIKNVDVMNVEMTSDPLHDGWCDMMETHRWLVDHGFKRQSVHTSRSYNGQVDAIYVREHLFNPKHCSCPCSFM